MGTGGRNIKNEQIYQIIENLNQGFQALDFEFGNGEMCQKLLKMETFMNLKCLKKYGQLPLQKKL